MAGTPVGFGASENSDNDISDVWVSPTHEGKGAGSALVTAFVDTAKLEGFGDVSINVAAYNGRALGLYKHLGFIEQWRRNEFDPVLSTTIEKVGLKKL